MLLGGKARHQHASELWAMVAQKLTGLLRVSLCSSMLCWVVVSRSVVSSSLCPHGVFLICLIHYRAHLSPAPFFT